MTVEREWKRLKKHRILIGSPVYQKPEILNVFLNSLRNLTRESFSIDYMFVDDNAVEESRQLLHEFHPEGASVTIVSGKDGSAYLCDDETHHWDDTLMHKVADFKNSIIEHAVSNQYDYLFFVDSDLVLHPSLLEHLKSCGKDIISEVFWSRWHDGLSPEPNVWLFDEYDLVPKKLGERISGKEAEQRRRAFLEQLHIPGVYEVGGLGACTLISRAALLRGVSFAPISNLTIHGEDRFFCIRAAVLGLGMFVDTRYPAYHIYREQDLTGVSDYVKRCKGTLLQPETARHFNGKLTLSMVVRNEEKRYLKRMLKSLVGHIDEAVIIDDGSTDGTISMCRTLLKGIPLHIIRNETPMFDNEIALRQKQWSETVKTNPEWILNLDADEVIEAEFWSHVSDIIGDVKNEICCFHLYDMWNETQYREDEHWNAQAASRTFLLRYRPDFDYQWSETPQHCGRFPNNISVLPKAKREFRILHFGWSTPEDRRMKYQRYQLLDPGAVYGSREQYETILDTNPRLLDWETL